LGVVRQRVEDEGGQVAYEAGRQGRCFFGLFEAREQDAGGRVAGAAITWIFTVDADRGCWRFTLICKE
jgi:hypothetical protein